MAILSCAWLQNDVSDNLIVNVVQSILQIYRFTYLMKFTNIVNTRVLAFISDTIRKTNYYYFFNFNIRSV